MSAGITYLSIIRKEGMVKMRIEYFKQLLEITQKQTLALENEDVELMRKLITEKQEILDVINRLNWEEKSSLDDEEKMILIEIQELDMKNNIEFKAQIQYAKGEVRKINILNKREEYYSNQYGSLVESNFFIEGK